MNATSPLPLVESLAETVAGCLDTASLQAIANLQLDAPTQERLDALAERANEGRITAEERAEYQAFTRISEFLALAQLRARARLGLPLAA
jgi:hypothetical protein